MIRGTIQLIASVRPALIFRPMAKVSSLHCEVKGPLRRINLSTGRKDHHTSQPFGARTSYNDKCTYNKILSRNDTKIINLHDGMKSKGRRMGYNALKVSMGSFFKKVIFRQTTIVSSLSLLYHSDSTASVSVVVTKVSIASGVQISAA